MIVPKKLRKYTNNSSMSTKQPKLGVCIVRFSSHIIFVSVHIFFIRRKVFTFRLG